MKDKSLQSKAIDIKGKKYVQVSERVLFFNEEYPNGYIATEILTDLESAYIVIRARATPDAANPLRRFTGHSQATVGDGMVNKTAALENAETSAVGRALALMGIGVIESIASADEMNKTTYPARTVSAAPRVKTAFEKQVEVESDMVKLKKMRAKVATMNYGASQKNRMYATLDERIREVESGGKMQANSVGRQEEVRFKAEEELVGAEFEDQIAAESEHGNVPF